MTAFGSLAPLRQRAIPDQQSSLVIKSGYREHPLDPIPVDEDPLVDALASGLLGENYYASDRNPPHYRRIPGAVDRLWSRAGVVERLRRVDALLAPEGLALWLHDAWRPTVVQRYFHDVWMPAALRALGPDWDAQTIAAEVDRYWSTPTVEEAAPAPHLTGGAVDVSLCWRDTHQPLWMGSLFDDVGDLAHLDCFETIDAHALRISDREAAANRRLLYWAMTGAGFCANPTEWWHYSYGDQMWARLTDAPAAFYGAINPPAQ